MKTKANFRRIDIEMTSKGRGQYRISAIYKGIQVNVHSTDSETYDWLNDDSNKEKHQDAKRSAYNAIVRQHNTIHQSK